MEVFPAGKDWGGLKIGHTETPDQGFQVLVPMRKRIKMRPSEDMGPYVVQGREVYAGRLNAGFLRATQFYVQTNGRKERCGSFYKEAAVFWEQVSSLYYSSVGLLYRDRISHP